MISENLKKILEKQHYGIAGKHSAVQICRWAKKALLDEGFCYKEQFYGIKSHLCCQMSPSIAWCPNKCIHCWRAVEFTQDLKEIENAKKTDNPKEIIEECVKQQRKLLTGFKSNKKINMKKWEEAQNPRQFAISLAGEPTLYPKLAELIKELRKQKKTSFLVTNGLYPEKIKELQKHSALPTQIYISLNTPNEKMYQEWHKSQLKDAWKRFNETIELFKKLKGKTRTVVRMTLVKDLN
ncbi:MAG: radical SAM protein, partial [Nanoarchaeota archaeon]|nr:radical SAM protein [Nanoarchaeota archaeon]